MNSLHEDPITTSFTSRVTAIRIKAAKRTRYASIRPGDPIQKIEIFRFLAAIFMICGYCYQYEAFLNNGLYANRGLQMFLLNIQNIVSLFFVLAGAAGFLPFTRAILRQQKLYSIKTFLLHRAIRLIPIYYTAVLLTWLLHFNGQPYQWHDLLEHLTFTQIFDRKDIFQTIEPAWIFAVEIWFYLLLACLVPFIHTLCSIFSSKAIRMTILCSISIVFIVGGLLYKLWLLKLPYDPTVNPVLFYTFPRFDNFGTGMLLAVVIAISEIRKPRPLLAWIFCLVGSGSGFITYFISTYYISNAIQSLLLLQTLWGLTTLFLCLAIIIGTNRYSLAKEKNRFKRLLRYSSLISYGIIIWYTPLFTWLSHYFLSSSTLIFSVGLLCFMLITMAVASLSYWLIEYPISFLSYLFTHEGQLSQRYEENR